jgi:hypothetical protein
VPTDVITLGIMAVPTNIDQVKQDVDGFIATSSLSLVDKARIEAKLIDASHDVYHDLHRAHTRSTAAHFDTILKNFIGMRFHIYT